MRLSSLRLKLIIFLLPFILLTPVFSQSRSDVLGIRLNGFPLVPLTSEVYGELAARNFSSLELLENVSVRAWLLSDSAYILPKDYFELGASLHWNFGALDHPVFIVGVGTALSYGFDTSSISIPLILDLGGKYRIGRSWLVEPQLRGFLYGEGLIAEAKLQNSLRIFSTGFGITVGGHFQYAYSWVQQLMAMGLGISAGLQYWL